jgi:integrase/recombinase XerC
MPTVNNVPLAAGVAPPLGDAVLVDFMAARSPLTMKAYSLDLADFARVTGAASIVAAIDQLLTNSSGEAHRLALHYRDALQTAGKAPATIARRMATLRSLVRLAHRLGRVAWTLDAPAPRVTPYRDTRGPGRAGFLRLVAAAEAQAEPKRARDLAIIWLLYGRALRRSEICRLRAPEDLDLPNERIRILGKHRTEPEWVTIPPATCRAVEAWLLIRGTGIGPLFIRLDRSATAAAERSGPPGSLTGEAVRLLLASLGQSAGIRVRPHGLRHAAVTEALAATHGDLRSVQRFARLKSANTIRIYDDDRTDIGGEVSRLLAP